MYYATMAAKTETDPIAEQIRQIGEYAFRLAVMHLNRPTNTPAHLTGILVSQSASLRPFPQPVFVQ